MVDALTLMNRRWFDGGNVLGQPVHQFLRRARDLGNRVKIVVLEVNLIQIPCGGGFDFAAVSKSDFAFPVQRGVNAVLRHRCADHVARERLRRVGFRIPHDEITQLRMLFVGDALNLLARAVGGQRACVIRKHLSGAQSFAVIGADEQREIRELLHEGFVIPLLLDHQARDAQPQRRVGGGPDGNPIIGLG